MPAGTIEPGEAPEQAVLREAVEETGRDGWSVHCLLEHRTVDMHTYGVPELHDRWFFHLVAPVGLPAAWQHGESDPSSGPYEFIAFDFWWLDRAVAARDLRGENQPALAVLRACLADRIEGNRRS